MDGQLTCLTSTTLSSMANSILMKADPAVFYTHKNNDIAVLACHIDNCTITGSSKQLIQSYKDKLQEKYLLTDLGMANWLLGIKITRNIEWPYHNCRTSIQCLQSSTSLISNLSLPPWIRQFNAYKEVQLYWSQTSLYPHGSVDSIFKGSMPWNNWRDYRNEESVLQRSGSIIKLLCCGYMTWHCFFGLVISPIYGQPRMHN